MIRPEDSPAHPFSETRDRFPDDAYLRRHGFRIERRPAGVSAIWRRGGRVVTHGTAMVIAAEEDRAKLEA